MYRISESAMVPVTIVGLETEEMTTLILTVSELHWPDCWTDGIVKEFRYFALNLFTTSVQQSG